MSFETFEGAATAAFILTGIVVGMRLLALGARTREVAELSIGAGFLLIVGIGYPLYIVAGVAPDLSLDAARRLATLASLCMNGGWACLCLFTWRVFRPDVGWARALALAFLLGFVLLAALRWVELARATDRLGLVEVSASLIAIQALALALYVWTGIEALLCHARLVRQLALGLVDPVVVNRVLLWAWVTVFSFLSLAPGFVATLFGVRIEQAPAFRLIAALAGLGCAVTLSLAFFPPRFYLRRVARATA